MNQLFNMFNRRLRQDAMAQIEDMRPIAIGGQYFADSAFLSLAAGYKGQRIEVTLQNDSGWHGSRSPSRVDGRV
jgi:hypothetical protein